MKLEFVAVDFLFTIPISRWNIGINSSLRKELRRYQTTKFKIDSNLLHEVGN